MKLSALSPSGDMRTSEVSLSMSRSLPVLIPVRAVTAAIFEARLNPASFALNNPTLPAMTSLLVGPVMSRLEECARRKRRAFGNVDAQSGEKRLQVFRGHILRIRSDFDHGD